MALSPVHTILGQEVKVPYFFYFFLIQTLLFIILSSVSAHEIHKYIKCINTVK